MTPNEISFVYPAGAAQNLWDLDIGVCASLLSDARVAVRDLRRHRPLRAAGDGDDPLLDALAAAVLRAVATCDQGIHDLEKGYLTAHREREEQTQIAVRQRSFLADFRSRMRFIGTSTVPTSWSLLGWADDRPDQPTALGRDRGNVTLVSGVPGSGKTVFSTVVGEGGLSPGEPLASEGLLPTAYIFFHLEENDRLPQLLDGLKPNPTQADLQVLMTRLGVGGQGLLRLRLVIPEMLMTVELMARLAPYEDLGLEVVPLKAHLGQIGQPGLEAALGAESGARFVQRMLEDAQDQGRALTTERMRKFIDEADDLNVSMKRSARARLRVLSEIESPPGGPGMWQMFEPGVATVVYLGGPHMGHGRVAPMLVSMLSGLMMPSEEHGQFQRVIAVDEVNLLDRDDAAWRMMVRAARLARHRGWTLILMGQDLLCVPDEMFAVAGICAVFRQSSPQIWEHLRQRIGALRHLRWEDVESLGIAEALVTSLLSTDGAQVRRVKIRPPLCMHGGYTRGAL